MKITIDKLRKLAKSLQFSFKEEEYLDVLNEFNEMLACTKMLDEVESYQDYEPMTFPLIYDTNGLRDDIEEDPLLVTEVLSNAKDTLDNQVKLPKVVN